MSSCKKTSVLFFLFFFCVFNSVYSQFTFRLTVKNPKDSIVYFRSTLFDQTNYIPKDTFRLKKQNFTFKNKQSIVGGIYYLYFPQSKQKIYLSLRNNDSTRIILDGDNYLGFAKSNDLKNNLFLDYQRLEKKFEVVDSLYDVELKKGRKFSFANKAAFFKEKTESLVSFRNEALKKIPSGDPLFLYFQTLNRLDESIPNRVNYQARNSFFTSTNWRDKQLIFTPVFKPLLQEYVNYYPLIGDSIMVAVQQVMKAIDCKSISYPYVMEHFGKLLQNRNIQNNVDIYLSFIKQYIQSDPCKVIKPAIKNKYLKDLKDLSQLKLDAPIMEMKLKDTASIEQSIYDFSKKYDYTVIAFYDPDCDHCQREVPEMDRAIKYIQNSYQLRIGRYYVLNAPVTSDALWKNFIKKYQITEHSMHVSITENGNLRDIFDAYSNPVFHLIDNKSRLKAKKISPISIKKWFEINQVSK